MTLAGRTIVVTGAASGIGRATAHLLREHGAEVVGVDRSPDAAGHHPVYADLSTPDGIERALQQLPERVDGLCAIAGVPGTAGVERVRAVNYLSVRHLVSRLVDRMPPGASIAVAASIAGGRWRERAELHTALDAASSFDDGLAWCRDHPVDEHAAYPFFKESLIVWARREAVRLRSRGIRVNSVSPGPVETPILADFRADLGDDRVQHDIDAVGRAGRPSDISPVFAFLMAPDSGWVSGVDLACDGGLAALTSDADLAGATPSPRT